MREWEPLWRAKLPEMDELFEVVVDSAFVGMRKPDPRDLRAHAGAARRREPPSECVFVDDLDVNCDAARELGMTAVRFESADQAIPEIRRGIFAVISGVTPDRRLTARRPLVFYSSAETRTQAPRAKPRGCEARRAAPETSVTGGALLKR